jgi:hypothetical protein
MMGRGEEKRDERMEEKLPSFAELMGPYLQNGFELVTQALFHLARGLNLYPCVAVAYYWPETSPVVFLLDEGVARIVAPRIEE